MGKCQKAFDTNNEFSQGLGEYENIEPSPSTSSTLIVSFKQRFEAEKLFYGPKDIPGVGKVELSWVASSSTTTPTTANATTPTRSSARMLDDDVKMGGANDDGNNDDGRIGGSTNGNGTGVRGGGVEQDFDVAEEDFDVAD